MEDQLAREQAGGRDRQEYGCKAEQPHAVGTAHSLLSGKNIQPIGVSGALGGLRFLSGWCGRNGRPSAPGGSLRQKPRRQFQLRHHVLHALAPPQGIFVQAIGDHHFDGRLKGGFRGQLWRRLFQNRLLHGVGLARKRWPAGQHFIQHGSVSEHVTPLVGRLAANLFRRGVGLSVLIVSHRPQDRCAVLAMHDRPRRETAVNHAIFVSPAQRFANADGIAQREFGFQRTGMKQLRQQLAMSRLPGQ